MQGVSPDCTEGLPRCVRAAQRTHFQVMRLSFRVIAFQGVTLFGDAAGKVVEITRGE